MNSHLDLSQPQPLLPLRSDFKVTFYDGERLDRYRDAVLHVLEHTGVRSLRPRRSTSSRPTARGWSAPRRWCALRPIWS